MGKLILWSGTKAPDFGDGLDHTWYFPFVRKRGDRNENGSWGWQKFDDWEATVDHFFPHIVGFDWDTIESREMRIKVRRMIEEDFRGTTFLHRKDLSFRYSTKERPFYDQDYWTNSRVFAKFNFEDATDAVQFNLTFRDHVVPIVRIPPESADYYATLKMGSAEGTKRGELIPIDDEEAA